MCRVTHQLFQHCRQHRLVVLCKLDHLPSHFHLVVGHAGHVGVALVQHDGAPAYTPATHYGGILRNNAQAYKSIRWCQIKREPWQGLLIFI